MKTLLTLLLLIPSISFANTSNENQVSFTLFGLSINEIFKKDEYENVYFWGNTEIDKCKIIDAEGNFSKSCYESNISNEVQLSPETPPPNPNKHFHDYFVKYEYESLIINQIRAYSNSSDIKTKKECLTIRDTIYKALQDKYLSGVYEEKYNIYTSKTGDGFDDKQLITFYDKAKFATHDRYSIQFELLCFFSNTADEKIRIMASLSRDYPRSVIKTLKIKDVDTSGF